MTDYRINGLRERNGIDGGDPRSGFGGRGVVTRSVNDNSTYDISRGRGRGRKKEEEVTFIRDALTQAISARKWRYLHITLVWCSSWGRRIHQWTFSLWYLCDSRDNRLNIIEVNKQFEGILTLLLEHRLSHFQILLSAIHLPPPKSPFAKDPQDFFDKLLNCRYMHEPHRRLAIDDFHSPVGDLYDIAGDSVKSPDKRIVDSVTTIYSLTLANASSRNPSPQCIHKCFCR